jgi:serine/threonine protein kinase
VEPRTFGRYKILGELGRGAMGAVYRAVDPVIEREVAIKTLLPNLPDDVMGEVRERFLREARSAGRLNHPNIVTIYDVGEENGIAYIAMELLEGRSLAHMLRDPQPIPFDVSADIAAQVADALDHAQRFSIVHRDVKPANVMVSATGRAKLTDFGVAYIPSSTMTQTGTALGSPRYMSPEQVLGLPIDPRSDLFSLGVVLYEMLTRRTPFERTGDTTVFALMNRIAGDPHTPLREVNPLVPAGFERVMQRALAKKPENRYQRGLDMANDLRHLDRPQAAPARAPQAADETVIAATVIAPLASRVQAAAAPVEDEKSKSQLLNDLETFSRNFEREEQKRLRAEELVRLRKEEELRRWAESEAKKREAYERDRGTADAASTSPDASQTMTRALDMLRKQAAALPPREDPAVARGRKITELDKALRAAFQYLAELVRELNQVRPASGAPYEFLYVGRLEAPAIGDAFVDSRPLRLEGKDVCERVSFRYRITPTRPATGAVLGADVERAPQYFKSLRVPHEFKPEGKNDFGQTTRAAVTVTGPLPCQVDLRGDYETFVVTAELINVRTAGRVECKLRPEELGTATDDLARYILGADADFEKLLRRR